MIDAAAAYARCEEITRREARNFAYGIRLLHTPERQALSAVYAFARRVDDISDGDWPADRKLFELSTARCQLEWVSAETTQGVDTHVPARGFAADPVLVALADASRRYPLPFGAFGHLIDGCERDVCGAAYRSMEELVDYCRQVAGSIGRLSLAVFGCDNPAAAEPLADDLGVALQLTNILRDVEEDRAMGRVYLPTEDAIRFGCAPDATGLPGDVAELIRHEAHVARDWFDRGLQLQEHLHGRPRACVAAMAGIYERLLRRIERDPLLITRGHLSLPGWEKAWVAAKSIAGVAA
jgi:phytoene synthase